jgi:lysophospholipid acyltransferase (LPLAT)-like uncharacterized protein
MTIFNKQSMLASAMTFSVRMWCRSLHYILEGEQPINNLHQDNERVVYAIWHDELFPLCYLHRDEGIVAVVSASRDGEMLAQVLARLGYNLARGSSTRGGVKALIAASRVMKKEAKDAVLTLDGPRGPRHQVKEGALYLAWRADAYLVPVRAKISSKKCFKSWDKFQLPLLGAVCHIHYGSPYKLEYKKLDEGALHAEKKRLLRKLESLA